VIGKTFGITLFSRMAVKLGISKMPKHVRWMHIIVVGMLGGVEFTMIIFIVLLSLSEKNGFCPKQKFYILTA